MVEFNPNMTEKTQTTVIINFEIKTRIVWDRLETLCSHERGHHK